MYFKRNWKLFNTYFVATLSSLGASHVKAMTTDPGAIPIGNATPANIQRMGLKENQVVYKCAKCCSIKPERSHHCSVCQRFVCSCHMTLRIQFTESIKHSRTLDNFSLLVFQMRAA